MYKECRHIQPSGHKCKSPALRGQSFCYYHTSARRLARISRTSAEPLLFPSIEDTGGVQIALNQIFREFGAHRLDRRQAGVYLYGLQIAAGIARKSDEKPSRTVREVSEESENGTLVAPEKTTCEPPLDCLYCLRREFCPDFGVHRRKAKELLDCLRAEEKAREQNPDLETCTPKPFDQ